MNRLNGGRQVISAANQPKRLHDISTVVIDVDIFPLPDNTDVVYITGDIEGGFGMSGGEQGYPLYPNGKAHFDDVDLSEIYIASATASQGVHWGAVQLKIDTPQTGL